MKSKIEAFKFTSATALLIIVALLLPSSVYRGAPRFFGIDKIAHFALFFLFAVCYLTEYRRYNGRMPSLPHGILLVVVFILSSELLQLLTATRHFEFMDMAFDAAGAGAAFAISLIASRRDGKR
jgi:VanZ family protein